jgi:hypothetical protein
MDVSVEYSVESGKNVYRLYVDPAQWSDPVNVSIDLKDQSSELAKLLYNDDMNYCGTYVKDFKLKYVGYGEENVIKGIWEDNQERGTVSQTDDGSTWAYTREIAPNAFLSTLDLNCISDIFSDSNNLFITGEVYVGTQSTGDVSDTMSYDQFQSAYLAEIYFGNLVVKGYYASYDSLRNDKWSFMNDEEVWNEWEITDKIWDTYPTGYPVECGGGAEQEFTVQFYKYEGDNDEGVYYLVPFVVKVETRLDSAVQYVPYSQELGQLIGDDVTGGFNELTYKIGSGTLPSGLTVDSKSGELSGVPTVSGTFDFSVAVYGNGDTLAQREFTLTVEKPEDKIV